MLPSKGQPVGPCIPSQNKYIEADMSQVSQTELGTETPIAYRKKPVAVIDVGAMAVRMEIAEINPDGGVRSLERLTQAVALGKDTFTTGRIAKSTLDECVTALINYREKLKEYRIDSPEQIRLVATSAVREAENRLSFIDRIFVSTGLDIEILDESEVHRIIYLGILRELKNKRLPRKGQTVVVEVGGGSTELIVLNGLDIDFSHAYRLGSLRLRETLEAFDAPGSKFGDLMASHISQALETLPSQIPETKERRLVCLGGDIRFAADQLIPNRNPDESTELSVEKLDQFTKKLLELDSDETAKRYHLSIPDAEAIGPSLLANLELARLLNLNTLHVSNVNLREGLLLDLASKGVWSRELQSQVIRSAVNLGRKFEYDESHALHVAKLSRELFRALQSQHQLGPRHELFLYVAAILHEVGLFISNAGYHKHTLYLILNSELFGLSRYELQQVALVARYHRKASPRESHSAYMALNRDDRIAVYKMAALLRVAIALNASRSQRIHEFQVRAEGKGKLIISIPEIEDLSLEQLALRQNASQFEEIFGRKVLLRGQNLRD